MANVRVATKKTSLKMGNGDGPPETFTAIGGITSVSGPSEDTEQIEVTDFDSDGKEYVGGLEDGGEVTLNYNLDPDSTTQASLRSARGEVKNFQIVLNDATATKTVPSQFAFAALIKSVTNSADKGDVWKGTVTLKVSGAVTFTARHAGT